MFRLLRSAPPTLTSRPRARNFFVDKTALSSDSGRSRRARVRQAVAPEDRAAAVGCVGSLVARCWQRRGQEDPGWWSLFPSLGLWGFSPNG